MKTTLRLGLIAVLAGCGPATGPAGPQGVPGPTGMRGEPGNPGPGFNPTPAVAAVAPQVVVAGQSLDVAITGAATEWTNGALIAFGAGITVSKVASPSPLALIASIVVDRLATPGTRDIAITQNGKTVTWKGAFTIKPLYRAEVLGKPGRGALAIVRVTSNDPDFTFDTSWSGSAYSGVRATTSPASLAVVHDVKPRQVDVLVTGDIDSPLGMRDLRLTNQFGRPTERVFNFPQLFDFADLAEQAVDGGAPINGTFAQPYGSAQFKYQASGTEQLASITSTGGAGAPTGHPMLAVLSSAGKFTGTTVVLQNSYTFTPFTGPYYFVAFDPSGAGGYGYTFSVATLSKTAEVEPNDSKETAPALTLPSLQSAALSAATDVDMFKVVVTDNEVGRHLRVRTRYASQYYTDTKVEVLRPDGTVFGASLDNTYQDELRTDALTGPGDWLVKISNGAYYPPWSISKSSYDLLVAWE